MVDNETRKRPLWLHLLGGLLAAAGVVVAGGFVALVTALCGEDGDVDCGPAHALGGVAVYGGFLTLADLAHGVARRSAAQITGCAGLYVLVLATGWATAGLS